MGSLAVVKEVDVSRQWPDRVLIEIVEREAIAVVEIGGRLRGMDAEGVVFRDYNRAPPGLPRVQTDIGTSAEALREAALVISALPESLTLLVDYLQVTTVDEISLFLKDGRQVVWGSADDSETKAEVAIDLLQTDRRGRLRRQRARRSRTTSPVTRPRCGVSPRSGRPRSLLS